MALTDNLIGFWPLDEASGNAIDAHSSGLTLTETSGTIDAAAAAGPDGSNARDFEDADTEYFARTSEALLETGDIDFTVQAWVKAESLSSFPIPVRKGSTTDGTVEWALFVDTSSGNVVQFGVNGVTYVGINSGSAISVGSWACIHAWHDSVNNQIGISINAGTAATAAHSAGVTISSAYPFAVGASIGQALYWDGLLQRVGFWKRVLTSGERTSLYNSGSGMSYAAMSGVAGGVIDTSALMRRRHVRGGRVARSSRLRRAT